MSLITIILTNLILDQLKYNLQKLKSEKKAFNNQAIIYIKKQLNTINCSKVLVKQDLQFISE